MKLILLLLLIPFFPAGQTVHIKDGKIEYNETVKIKGISKATLYERAKEALIQYARGNGDGFNIDNNEKGIVERIGKIRLNSHHSIIKTVHYTIKINADDGEYKYKIDSVYIKEKERGYKTKEIPSEDLVKDMEESGIPAITAEKQLNEIDMEFQKIIAQLNKTMKGNQSKSKNF